MHTPKSYRRWWFVAAACLIAAVMVRFSLFPPQATADESDVYRVELVQNNSYKVQMGLNSMAKEGWFYVDSIPRSDGKILLVFRKSTR